MLGLRGAGSPSIAPDALSALHGTIGNRATSRLVLQRAPFHSLQRVGDEPRLIDVEGEDEELAHAESPDLPDLYCAGDPDAWVDAHRQELFPPNEQTGDLAVAAVMTIRVGMLKRELRAHPELEARAAAWLGVEDGDQWVGRGRCETVKYLVGGGRELHYSNEATGKTYNHYARKDGANGIYDPTWKQFFDAADTAGRPPIFRGTAAAFRAMGLPANETECYLQMFGFGLVPGHSPVGEFLSHERIRDTVGEWSGQNSNN